MKRTANGDMRSRMNRSAWSEAVLALLLLMSGCGNSSGTHQGFSTSVPPGTELKSLSSEQLATLCRDFAAFQVGVNAQGEEFNCREVGRLSVAFSASTSETAARAACRQAYDRCKMGFPADAGGNVSSCAMTTTPTSCTATVADLELCLNDLANFISSALAQTPSCDALTLSDLIIEAGSPVDVGPDAGPQGLPPSCVTFAQKCSGP